MGIRAKARGDGHMTSEANKHPLSMTPSTNSNHHPSTQTSHHSTSCPHHQLHFVAYHYSRLQELYHVHNSLLRTSRDTTPRSLTAPSEWTRTRAAAIRRVASPSGSSALPTASTTSRRASTSSMRPTATAARSSTSSIDRSL
jgi:hypothetical protein